jgi:multidrug efflux pump subunit AcrA (membrane-fusion protein)
LFQENSMKTSIIALALAASAFTGIAHAAVPAGESADKSSIVQSAATYASRNSAMAKTRADVRQELVQAQNDGQLANLRVLYRGS